MNNETDALYQFETPTQLFHALTTTGDFALVKKKDGKDVYKSTKKRAAPVNTENTCRSLLQE